MQNVHSHYRAGFNNQTYQFIGTRGVPRSVSGLATFQEKVAWRGTFAWMANTAFPIGKKHPNSNYPYFFAQQLLGDIVPSWTGEVWQGTLEFAGVFNPGKTMVSEEIGTYIQGKAFPKIAGGTYGTPSIILPGRTSNVNDSQVNQLVPSYSRSYISTTAPELPFVDSFGVETKPLGWVAPMTPAALTWLFPQYATYTYPNGWYLASRTTKQMRLSDGTLIPLYDVSEQWLYVPAASTL